MDSIFIRQFVIGPDLRSGGKRLRLVPARFGFPMRLWRQNGCGELAFARAHLREIVSIEQLAKATGLSPRQFGRVFLAETGQTPAKAVEKLRAETARIQIEKSDEPIEAVARAVGFADPERMRRAFVRTFGHPPQALRRMARADRSNRGEKLEVDKTHLLRPFEFLVTR